MLTAPAGAYHWNRSIEQLRPWLGTQQAVIAGIPRTMRRAPFSKIQRVFIRKWLGIGQDRHVVIYAASAERNNMAYGPYTENDLQYMEVTESILSHLAERYPDSVVLLKLYPTHRYPHAFELRQLLRNYPNVIPIKDIDFRFLRSAADLIALSSSQSTLGWAWGSGIPVVMYEKEASPVRLPGKELPDKIPGVRRILELDNLFAEPCNGDMTQILSI